MKLDLWQVDAFATKVLEGNPAALVPLETWLDTALMQRIAGENNLAETAYFVNTAPGKYDLRWFTPAAEVDLCGHATLASAWLIFEKLVTELSSIDFETRSGTLTVTRGENGWNIMSLPSDPVSSFGGIDLAQAVGATLGVEPALSEIRTHREKFYDPRFVDACLTLFDQGKFQFTDTGTPSALA